MKSWKSTIGGSFAAVGTFLVGAGVMPQLAGSPSKSLNVVAWIGFVCQGIGIFLGHLFSADNDVVKQIRKDVDANTRANISGDSSPLVQPKDKT